MRLGTPQSHTLNVFYLVPLNVKTDISVLKNCLITMSTGTSYKKDTVIRQMLITIIVKKSIGIIVLKTCTISLFS